MRSLFAVSLASLACSGLAAQQPYKVPPQVIVDILDTPPLPGASVSPDRQWLLLLEQRSMPAIAELAQPILRIAGTRINPRTTGPQLPGPITGLVLKRVADGAERRITVPAPAALSFVSWSPDSRTIAFVQTRDSGLALWVADAATGQARALTGPSLNATNGPPCQWMPGAAASTRLLCEFVPDGRGPAPVAPATPVGPTTQETQGRASPAPTYEDLLKNANDERLFDYYFTAQLATVDVATGARALLGAPAIFERVDVAPGGEYVLIARTVRPYSYLVPAVLFAQDLELWNLRGEVVVGPRHLPLGEGIPIRGVRPGPRAINWRPGVPATLVWAEALDGGDPRTKVDHQDRVLTLSAPFNSEPVELARLVKRYSGLLWDTLGTGLLAEYDRERRWLKTWILDAAKPGAAPTLLFDRSAEDRYGDPGFPVLRMTAAGDPALLRTGDWIYLVGSGASPQGERPFLDRLSVTTKKAERLWRADTAHYESVVALIDDAGRTFITRRESHTEPPNYFVRRGNRLRPLTAFKDPAPQLTGIEKRLVTYTREDGVPLSGTLYLPPGYRAGTRLPVVMWAYPTEFASATAAGQVTAAPNRFNIIRGPSHLFFLTQGYAVLDDPKMPIIGGDTANDHYVDQLVMNARAAVKAVVDLGVADPDRIGVGGHSYGAFMTANLLAHCDLFRAGIARSGAYNRTLTPFGFQNEDRTFWQARNVYLRMSPFVYADSINEPILMTHGEADNNSGTFPINSERLFAAIKGLGGTARLVMLPNESHGYVGRESVLHTLAEMIDWFDRYVKQARPRQAGVSSSNR
ncbi:MAG TPA: prolyl oligopeptidase family serine peptidase [Gemmatimonadales bacterium]|jgi:dipeptidyl aminopeptidase/acylaminoacyl peptidase|nr:prolyl oligopeptidase family serine peptidase [Gemmatimonadales bacterium]